MRRRRHGVKGFSLKMHNFDDWREGFLFLNNFAILTAFPKRSSFVFIIPPVDIIRKGKR